MNPKRPTPRPTLKLSEVKSSKQEGRSDMLYIKKVSLGLSVDLSAEKL
jgi:hypothetical protein